MKPSSSSQVVLEYCEYGALDGLLKRTEVPEEKKLLVAGDCAEGLMYLTERGYLHRDVAARNVLLNSEYRGKIADFGLSRESQDDSYYISRGGALPVRWTAPEALEKKKFSAASDVWAYGILLYEIWTRAETPYKGLTNNRVWVEVTAGYRLPCPEGCEKEVHDRMLSW